MFKTKKNCRLLKTPQKAKLKTKCRSRSKMKFNLNYETNNSQNSSKTGKENQCRPKREASINARIISSMVLQDELLETKRQKLANCVDFFVI